MRVKVFGTGAAGNKGAISLVEGQVVDRENVYLVNSTERDIPEAYRDRKLILSGSTGGCAKESAIGEQLGLLTVKERSSELESLVDPSDDMVIIIGSAGGGTGCGSSVVLGRFYSESVGISTVLFSFTGFEDDEKELKNTISYFNKLTPLLTIQSIKNNKFLGLANNNRLKAEALANKELCTRVSVLIGNPVLECDQNIDENDLFELATTPKFMNIEYREIPEKIKNTKQFESILSEMLDDSKSFELDGLKQTRMGVIISLSKDEMDFIDPSLPTVKARIGAPKKLYTHIDTVHPGIRHIAIISAGMELPVDELQVIYNKYLEQKEANAISSTTSVSFDLDDDDDMNIRRKRTVTTSDFLSTYGSKDANGSFVNTSKRMKMTEVDEDDVTPTNGF